MSDWLQGFAQWVTGIADVILAWLGEQFGLVLDSLNPINLVIMAIYNFLPFLPRPNTQVMYVLLNMRMGAVYIAQYIALLDYFVDVRFFFICVIVVLIFEAALVIPRVWRFIRSFIT